MQINNCLLQRMKLNRFFGYDNAYTWYVLSDGFRLIVKSREREPSQKRYSTTSPFELDISTMWRSPQNKSRAKENPISYGSLSEQLCREVSNVMTKRNDDQQSVCASVLLSHAFACAWKLPGGEDASVVCSSLKQGFALQLGRVFRRGWSHASALGVRFVDHFLCAV